jgi:hypothetical protein
MAPYDPPVMGAHYTQLDVQDVDPDVIWKMIGKGGKGFYDLTDYLELKYLWYNPEKKFIELWGPYNSLKNGAIDKLKAIVNAHVELSVSS